MIFGARPRRSDLDRVIVGDQRNHAGFGNPVEQALVTAVASGAGMGIEQLAVGLLVHDEDDPVVAGARADEDALFALHLVLINDRPQLVIGDDSLATAG